MKDWFPFIFVVLAICAIVGISIICGGCKELKRYEKFTDMCERMCKNSQKENVGATFFYKNIRATFGQCKCHSRNGNIKKFNISIDDISEK